jgi:D-alanyl-D-alanine carboxypeptidase
MKQIRWLFAVAVAVAVLPLTAVAQERGTVGGAVVDGQTRQPLAGAQVSITGTQLGTITNVQGRFLIPTCRPARARCACS